MEIFIPYTFSQGFLGLLEISFVHFIYFTFRWSYTDVEPVMYTFSMINKVYIQQMLCLVISEDNYVNN